MKKSKNKYAIPHYEYCNLDRIFQLSIFTTIIVFIWFLSQWSTMKPEIQVSCGHLFIMLFGITITLGFALIFLPTIKIICNNILDKITKKIKPVFLLLGKALGKWLGV